MTSVEPTAGAAEPAARSIAPADAKTRNDDRGHLATRLQRSQLRDTGSGSVCGSISGSVSGSVSTLPA